MKIDVRGALSDKESILWAGRSEEPDNSQMKMIEETFLRNYLDGISERNGTCELESVKMRKFT